MRPLQQAAHQYYGEAPIGIGAGTQHLLEILPPLLREHGAGPTVMVPAIGYQEHAFCWQKWGYNIQHYQHSDTLLQQDWDIAVLINPNNPTASFLPTQQQQPLFNRLSDPQRPRWLIVDEAFMDSTPQHSWLGQPRPDTCILLRSVGKFFGLAGARVGFAFGPKNLRAPLRVLTGPWPIATPAAELVRLALLDQHWQQQAHQSLANRNRIFQNSIIPLLQPILGHPYQHTTLFYTWHTTPGHSHHAFEQLHQLGIHTRKGDGWIRLSLPSDTEITRLHQRLNHSLAGHLPEKCQPPGRPIDEVVNESSSLI